MIMPAAQPPHLAAAIAEETRGHTIICIEPSAPTAAFRSGLLMWIIGIPWTVFTVAWEVMAISASTGLFGSWDSTPPLFFRILFPLWGLPFIAVGMYMLTTPFRMAREVRNTATLLTDRAVMTVTQYPHGRRTINSQVLSAIMSIKRTELADGSGTLELLTGRTVDDSTERDISRTFKGIADVRHVEDQLRAAIAKATR